MRVVWVEPSRSAADLVGQMLAARHHEVRTFADGHDACDEAISAVAQELMSGKWHAGRNRVARANDAFVSPSYQSVGRPVRGARRAD